MADFSKLKATLAYARLGLVSLAATVVPITGTAQELCGTDLFAGEADAAQLMNQTMEFLGILESNGVVAFDGAEGRVTVDGARRALQDGVGSASLLACVVNASSVEFAGRGGNRVVACGPGGASSIGQPGGSSPGGGSGQMFCTVELATISQYLGSQG